MKLLALILFAIIALLQYPLWFSKSSWKRVWQVEEEVTEARQNNLKLQQRNNMLEAELSDLKQGLEAVEERARSDLGMVKQNEVLFQIVRIESQKQENQSPTHENNSSPKNNTIDHISTPLHVQFVKFQNNLSMLKNRYFGELFV